MGSKAAGPAVRSVSVTVNSGVTGSAVSQTAPTLSTETGSGSVTITSTTTARVAPVCATDRLPHLSRHLPGHQSRPAHRWNDNPRATVFDQKRVDAACGRFDGGIFLLDVCC